jgi:hypothetical protein
MTPEIHAISDDESDENAVDEQQEYIIYVGLRVTSDKCIWQNIEVDCSVY